MNVFAGYTLHEYIMMVGMILSMMLFVFGCIGLFLGLIYILLKFPFLLLIILGVMGATIPYFWYNYYREVRRNHKL
jgi:UDP-N-acetylmuramyl pentapeptide phosphotransferase/UDP-N-acetylglucosamine-1-phosphate transferase